MLTQARFRSAAEQYLDMVYRIALNWFRDIADAEDATGGTLSGGGFDHRHINIPSGITTYSRPCHPLLAGPLKRTHGGIHHESFALVSGFILRSRRERRRSARPAPPNGCCSHFQYKWTASRSDPRPWGPRRYQSQNRRAQS